MDKQLHEELNGILEQMHQRSEQQEGAVPEQDEVADTSEEQQPPPPRVGA